MMNKKTFGVRALCTLLLFSWCGPLCAEDGYDLWLRYAPLDASLRAATLSHAAAIVAPADPSTTTEYALQELSRGLHGLLATAIPRADRVQDGSIALGTPATSPVIEALHLPLERLGREGYLLQSTVVDGHPVTVIAANADIGLMYGTFALLRKIQAGYAIENLHEASKPAIERRLLNHWDNLDRTVERGYAGQSIWDWWRLPDFADPRYRDYARANASVGINGTVLNNVNAKSDSLTPRYIAKAAALADVFRPWGIRVYLSARFSAPLEIGGLATADPLDPDVRRWWAAKADEIFAVIPDFGGFLVKANSEGQPGPQDYGRSHADGANMLAAAVHPHGGVVMWRAFVYADDNPEDRAKQAYQEFKPLDGKFADNVIVQVKNGPIDFQPREPFHPLFGAMHDTPVMLELQLTKEYLGFSTHLVYLGKLFEEALDADTYARGAGSTVAHVIDGTLFGYQQTGIAGVANIGSDRDWTGSTFNQADWFAFGRLAWNPGLPARDIAEDWLRMTFSNTDAFVQPALAMMLRSREAVVDYMTPLGLAHLMGTGHHYGPAPWVAELARPEWNPVYYHRADRSGIGFDRTSNGSNAIAQYAPEVARKFGDIEQVADEYLLWFHHVPWQHRMASGRTLWEELVSRYDRGIAEVEAMQSTWRSLRDYVDAERYHKTSNFLAVQKNEAVWWRDACLAYFSQVAGLPLPAEAKPAARSLDYYESLTFPYAP